MALHEIVSLCIASASLIFNVVIFILFNRRIAKQNQIINSYKIKELEESDKARLSAQVSVETYWQDYNSVLYLVVNNQGPAIARDIEVKDLCEGDFTFTDTESFFPIKELGANGSVEIPLFVCSDMHNNIRVSISWVDDTGEITTRSQILNIK